MESLHEGIVDKEIEAKDIVAKGTSKDLSRVEACEREEQRKREQIKIQIFNILIIVTIN